MYSFNTTLFNLGVNTSRDLPRMWETIDKEMDLLHCNNYTYSPDDVSNDPYGDEGLIWSTSLFFFNKHRKRVCYLYLRGLSTLNHSPSVMTTGEWGQDSGLGHGGGEESDEEGFDDDFIESKSIWGSDDDGFFEGMEV
jgi:hypothetical protein